MPLFMDEMTSLRRKQHATCESLHYAGVGLAHYSSAKKWVREQLFLILDICDLTLFYSALFRQPVLWYRIDHL